MRLRGESGAELMFKPAEMVSLLLGTSAFEPENRREWKTLLSPGDVVYDVGANIGMTVDRFWGLLDGHCDIWAFEPLPRNLELLRANVAAIGGDNIHVVASAVGDADGEAEFEDNELFPAVGQLTSVFTPVRCDVEAIWRKSRRISVPILKLDSFVERPSIAKPTFIKLDVEGAGHLVLEGAARVLEQTLPIISCSLHGPKEADGIRQVVRRIGYRGVGVKPDGEARWRATDQATAFVHPDRVPIGLTVN